MIPAMIPAAMVQNPSDLTFLRNMQYRPAKAPYLQQEASAPLKYPLNPSSWWILIRLPRTPPLQRYFPANQNLVSTTESGLTQKALVTLARREFMKDNRGLLLTALLHYLEQFSKERRQEKQMPLLNPVLNKLGTSPLQKEARGFYWARQLLAIRMFVTKLFVRCTSRGGRIITIFMFSSGCSSRATNDPEHDPRNPFFTSIYFNYEWVDPSAVSLIIQMSQKYRADYVSKSNPLNTPYIQLLDAKKKLYGYKYELVKQEKAEPPRKNSSGNSSLFTQSRPYKSFSNQKARPSKTQNSRKKRMYTEQADEPSGMHESLNIPPTHEGTHHASKSLFYPQISHQQPTQVIEFIQNFTNPLHKNRKGSKISNHSKGSQDSPDKNNPIDKGQPYHAKTDLSSLNIQDIDSLLTLIDNCVQEANQYIAFLSEKVQLMNIELNRLRASLQCAQAQLKIKNSLVLEKEKQIDALKKQPGVTYEGLTSNEAKKLIDMIEKVNHENDILRKKVEVLTTDSKDSRKKHSNDIFNEIHSKIDVLNIAIDNKGNNQGTHPHERRHKHSKSKQN